MSGDKGLYVWIKTIRRIGQEADAASAGAGASVAEQLQGCRISIVEEQWTAGEDGASPHRSYRVEVALRSNGPAVVNDKWTVSKRYTDFRELKKGLERVGGVSNGFPGKLLTASSDALRRRRADLEAWLRNVVGVHSAPAAPTAGGTSSSAAAASAAAAMAAARVAAFLDAERQLSKNQRKRRRRRQRGSRGSASTGEEKEADDDDDDDDNDDDDDDDDDDDAARVRRILRRALPYDEKGAAGKTAVLQRLQSLETAVDRMEAAKGGGAGRVSESLTQCDYAPSVVVTFLPCIPSSCEQIESIIAVVPFAFSCICTVAAFVLMVVIASLSQEEEEEEEE